MVTTTIDLSSLDGNNGFRLDGGPATLSGVSVSNAGDFNGDGFDDLIIGAPWAGLNIYDRSGSCYVVFGKDSGFGASLDLTTLNGTNGFRLDESNEASYLGRTVSNAGDVNGDGFDDLIVAVPIGTTYGESIGSSYVLFGKSSGFSPTLDLASLDGTDGFRLYGSRVSLLSTAGDVNGDGFDDLILGAPFVSSNGIDDAGAGYVVFGRASGFDKSLDVSKLNGSDGFRLNGVAEEDATGYSVSGAGDINGDGFDDVIVGVPRADPNGDFSGSSYVVFGKSSGFGATLDLASLNGINGFRLDGVSAQDDSGWSVSNAGDVNGDGFDDVIVGARGADGSNGVSYVIFGKNSGFDATLNLSTLDGNTGFSIHGAGAELSGWSVSNAGDVNSDAFDDLIIGAPFGDPNGIYSAGISYVVFGKASGFSKSLDLSRLDESSGFRLNGVADSDYSGDSVSTAGDINNDGFDDVIVGAYAADPNGGFSGSSYVVFGRSDFSNGGLSEIMGTPEDDQLKGTSVAEHLKAGDGNDRMIGRGGADIFDGGAGNDKINVIDLNFASVHGGSGNDILHTDGKDMNLDLTDYLDKIQGIETVCLYGRGDNTLTLTGAELQALSNTTDTLKVHGNAGDQVILEGNWVDEGSHGFYHTYTQDDAVLLVGMNMTAVFVGIVEF